MKIVFLDKFPALKNIAHEKRTWFIRIALLGLWSGFLFFMDRPFDAFAIVFLFLVVLLFRKWPYLLVAASIVVIVGFSTPVLDTWSKLKDLNLSTYHHVPPALDQLFRPDSGRQVLPVQVQQMISLIEAHGLTTYRMSKTLDEDGYVKQRMTEAAWPARSEITSPNLFSGRGDLKDYPNCEMVDQQKDVVLAYCH